mmetsp:Transcript_30162/g.86378  ORF Transcript_30162/g.86378 Transcript_30162/m.86378 type:complete len:207 (-) Transcript_30162:1202-1822(-)
MEAEGGGPAGGDPGRDVQHVPDLRGRRGHGDLRRGPARGRGRRPPRRRPRRDRALRARPRHPPQPRRRPGRRRQPLRGRAAEEPRRPPLGHQPPGPGDTRLGRGGPGGGRSGGRREVRPRGLRGVLRRLPQGDHPPVGHHQVPADHEREQDLPSSRDVANITRLDCTDNSLLPLEEIFVDRTDPRDLVAGASVSARKQRAHGRQQA